MTESKIGLFCLVQRDGIHECEPATPQNGRGDTDEGKTVLQPFFVCLFGFLNLQLSLQSKVGGC